ncbi:MAG: hypothetical protein OXD30_14630, partial [Bryobacterales bacterium]|nr:hypothetical protein [Bryobacterales bacterium]
HRSATGHLRPWLTAACSQTPCPKAARTRRAETRYGERTAQGGRSAPLSGERGVCVSPISQFHSKAPPRGDNRPHDSRLAHSRMRYPFAVNSCFAGIFDRLIAMHRVTILMLLNAEMWRHYRRTAGPRKMEALDDDGELIP